MQKDHDKSENDIKSLQSVGQIVGEVLKQLSEDKFIVKVRRMSNLLNFETRKSFSTMNALLWICCCRFHVYLRKEFIVKVESFWY